VSGKATGLAERDQSDLARSDPLLIAGRARAPLPGWLSSSTFKLQLFGLDTDAIEGFELVEELARDKTQWFCLNHSLLVVKPEVLVARSVDRVLAWLREMNFAIVEVVTFQFSPAITRGLWRYHWNAVTGDHREAVDLLVEAAPSVAILVSSETPDQLPASLRLAHLKGSADPTRRQPRQLRHELGSFNQLLNHVHSPDEPLDLLRELAVVLSRQQCKDAIRAALRRQALDPQRILGDLVPPLYAAAGPPQSLDVEEVLTVLAEDWKLDRTYLPDAGAALELSRVRGVPLSQWQQIVLRTSSVVTHRPGIERLVPSVSASEWSRAKIEDR